MGKVEKLLDLLEATSDSDLDYLAGLRGSSKDRVKLKLSQAVQGAQEDHLKPWKMITVKPGEYTLGGGNLEIEDLLINNAKQQKSPKDVIQFLKQNKVYCLYDNVYITVEDFKKYVTILSGGPKDQKDAVRGIIADLKNKEAEILAKYKESIKKIQSSKDPERAYGLYVDNDMYISDAEEVTGMDLMGEEEAIGNYLDDLFGKAADEMGFDATI